jgi:uncharacterized protein YqeY
MRAGDTIRRSLIRYLLSNIHDEEIARRSAPDDDSIIDLLGKQAQQRRDSIEAFRKGNREDLVEKEEAELAMILEYLPEQMSEDEIAALVQKAVEEVGATGPQDMGKVMGKVMPQVRGKSDGRTVSGVVSNLLKGLSG